MMRVMLFESFIDDAISHREGVLVYGSRLHACEHIQ